MSSEFLTKDVVYVNSNKRINGTSTNFTIDLSQQIKTPNNYDTATLLSFNCPKSYYLINSTNNTFVLNEDGNRTNVELLYGNYTFTSMAVELKTQLNISSFHGWSYNVTTDFQTGKFLFEVTGNTSQPSLDFSESNTYKILGFEATIYTFALDFLYSPFTVKMQLLSSLILQCNFVLGGVLSTIVPDITDFGLITYQEANASFTSQPLTITNFQQCNFSLYDGDNGGVIDLNGLDFEFVFAIYQKNSYFTKMIRDKQYEILINSLQSQY